MRYLFPFMLAMFLMAINTVGAQTTGFNIFPAGGWTVLAGSKRAELFHQCSRPAPTGITEFWQPSSSEISRLEKSLLDFLNEREKNTQTVPSKGVSFNRQYVGFIRNGSRFIYGNFYPVDSRFKGEPMMICDGGSHFWGVVYNADTGKFESIAFNGEA